MLYNRLDIYINNNRFQIKDLGISTNDWWGYFRQYHIAFMCLIHYAQEHNFGINPLFMPFMQLMRHSLELFIKARYNDIKSNIENFQDEVFNTHNLKELKGLLMIDCPFEILESDPTGEKFKYLTREHESDDIFSNYRICPCEDCNNYLKLINESKAVEYSKLINFESKITKNNFTFYPGECTTYGHTSRQYDNAVSILFDSIIDKNLKIEEMIYPLIFMLRHSFELKLKQTLSYLDISKRSTSKISKEHSLINLWNVLSSNFDKAIDLIDDNALKEETLRYKRNTNKFSTILSNLDKSSFLSRYPVDKNGNPHSVNLTRNVIYDILNVYKEADTFVCFGVEVLFEKGYLNLNEETMHYLMD